MDGAGKQRASTMSQNSGTKASNGSRPTSKEGDKNKKNNIWSSLLDGVGTGKRLPEKSLLVLGGNPDSQKQFLETLSLDPSDPRSLSERRKGKVPPVANQFALGYTYQDVLDADQDDILARLSIYLLSEPSASYAPLLRPLLTPTSIPDTLIVILLDWENPWTWVRQLRQWVRLLRSVLISLDDETKMVMEEVMTDWRDHKRGADTSSYTAGSGGPVSIPLGPGEWDEGLGIPMCVVCQGAEKIEKLEKEHGWREEEFDFVLQFMRTILLKHGSSLIYTTPFLAGSLQSLIHSSLGIHSLLKRQSLKHNVIDRDKILVPSNWDSWGKIRIIREGFDIEGVGMNWSIEIQEPPDAPLRSLTEPAESSEALEGKEDEEKQKKLKAEAEEEGPSAVAIYEQTIQDPRFGVGVASNLQTNGKEKIEIETTDTQTFLGQQLEVLEQLKAEDEKQAQELRKNGTGPVGTGATAVVKDGNADPAVLDTDESGRVNEHIGPVQFNMGGIQVDADDMLRKLKEREADRSASAGNLGSSPESTPGPLSSPPSSSATPAGGAGAGKDKPPQNQALASFFANLVKKPAGGTGSPKPGPTA